MTEQCTCHYEAPEFCKHHGPLLKNIPQSSNQRTHELKCWPPFFASIYDGSKPFEIRWDDRNYRVGDTLHIREFNPETECYTGADVRRRITYVFNSGNRFGLQPGWAVLGLAVETADERAALADRLLRSAYRELNLTPGNTALCARIHEWLSPQVKTSTDPQEK